MRHPLVDCCTGFAPPSAGSRTARAPSTAATTAQFVFVLPTRRIGSWRCTLRPTILLRIQVGCRAPLGRMCSSSPPRTVLQTAAVLGGAPHCGVCSTSRIRAAILTPTVCIHLHFETQCTVLCTTVAEFQTFLLGLLLATFLLHLLPLCWLLSWSSHFLLVCTSTGRSRLLCTTSTLLRILGSILLSIFLYTLVSCFPVPHFLLHFSIGCAFAVVGLGCIARPNSTTPILLYCLPSVFSTHLAGCTLVCVSFFPISILVPIPRTLRATLSTSYHRCSVGCEKHHRLAPQHLTSPWDHGGYRGTVDGCGRMPAEVQVHQRYHSGMWTAPAAGTNAPPPQLHAPNASPPP
uniref:Ribosomal RNA large subunit methyltransferase G n=1 Tax=Lygus hesperus TaxID=30085 RepID=A0A0A9Z0J1_LYGHE